VSQSNFTDIHTICGCLKDFLRNLKEPLVTFALWPEFVRAAGKMLSTWAFFYPVIWANAPFADAFK